MLIILLFIKSLIILSPRPSMFIAFLETKCLIISTNWAGHSCAFTHLNAASPSSLKSSLPQEGQIFGSFVFGFLFTESFKSTFVTWGMTSPARLIITTSPSLTSNRSTSSKLCKLAFEIVTPPTFIGSNSATGVTLPNLPTWYEIELTLVFPVSAGNFLAIAQRGALDTFPSRCWKLNLLTL